MQTMLLKFGFFCAAFLMLNSSAIYGTTHVRKIALIIGNSNYQQLPVLKNATNDTNAVAHALSANGFTVFLTQNSDTQDLKNSIKFVSKQASNADQILVYYAGHSIVQDGIIKLLSVDEKNTARAQNSTAISITQLLASFDLPFAQKTFIIDACLEVNNTMPNATQYKPTLPSTLAHETLLVFATSFGRAAYDGSGSHSLFAGAFLDQLTNAKQNLQTIIQSVRKSVINTSRSHQIPISISTLTHPFILGRIEQNSVESGLRNNITQSYSNSGYTNKPLLNAISSGLYGLGQ